MGAYWGSLAARSVRSASPPPRVQQSAHLAGNDVVHPIILGFAVVGLEAAHKVQLRRLQDIVQVGQLRAERGDYALETVRFNLGGLAPVPSHTDGGAASASRARARAKRTRTLHAHAHAPSARARAKRGARASAAGERVVGGRGADGRGGGGARHGDVEMWRWARGGEGGVRGRCFFREEIAQGGVVAELHQHHQVTGERIFVLIEPTGGGVRDAAARAAHTCARVHTSAVWGVKNREEGQGERGGRTGKEGEGGVLAGGASGRMARWGRRVGGGALWTRRGSARVPRTQRSARLGNRWCARHP